MFQRLHSKIENAKSAVQFPSNAAIVSQATKDTTNRSFTAKINQDLLHAGDDRIVFYEKIIFFHLDM